MSWTTVDPRHVKNYADAAGLPPNHPIYDGNAIVVEAEVVLPQGFLIGPADNSIKIPTGIGGGPGNAGGLLEIRIDEAFRFRITELLRITKPPVPFNVRPIPAY